LWFIFLTKPQWTSPPTQLQFSHSAHTKFVICDYAIELLFRWIKNHLQVKHFLSRSEHAVKIQLYAALITYLLVALFTAKELGAFKLSVRHLRQIKNMLDSLISETDIVRYLADLAAMAMADAEQSQVSQS